MLRPSPDFTPPKAKRQHSSLCSPRGVGACWLPKAESFDILHDQADPRSSAFIQTWSSREAHDDAFGELIMASGHLEKVLATLDEGVVQTFYDVVS